MIFTLNYHFVTQERQQKYIGKKLVLVYFFHLLKFKKFIIFSIKVVNDDFIVKPENEEISAVYEISASNILPKEVKVRMQHCAVVEEGDYLEFMVAHGDSPYCFKPLSGGVFPVNEFYGDIYKYE